MCTMMEFGLNTFQTEGRVDEVLVCLAVKPDTEERSANKTSMRQKAMLRI